MTPLVRDLTGLALISGAMFCGFGRGVAAGERKGAARIAELEAMIDAGDCPCSVAAKRLEGAAADLTPRDWVPPYLNAGGGR